VDGGGDPDRPGQSTTADPDSHDPPLHRRSPPTLPAGQQARIELVLALGVHGRDVQRVRDTVEAGRYEG
jgi:hypothetical protein